MSQRRGVLRMKFLWEIAFTQRVLAEHPSVGIQLAANGGIDAHQFAFALPIIWFRPAVGQQPTIHGTHYVTNNLRVHIVINLIYNPGSIDSAQVGIRIPADIKEPTGVADRSRTLRQPAPTDSHRCGHAF